MHWKIDRVAFREGHWKKKRGGVLVFSGPGFPFRYFSAREKDSSIGKNHDQKKKVVVLAHAALATANYESPYAKRKFHSEKTFLFFLMVKKRHASFVGSTQPHGGFTRKGGSEDRGRCKFITPRKYYAVFA